MIKSNNIKKFIDPVMSTIRRQRWGLFLLVFVILTYVIIFFIFNASPKNKVVEIYFADRISAAHQVLIEEYNKLNEGKVKIIPIDFPNFDFSTNERKEMLARSLRGRGDGIDLFAVDLVWVQRFAKWSEPLDSYFSNDEIKKLLPVALESCYYEGELVAVPVDMVQGIMYYREDLLKKTPDGENIIKKIKNNVTWSEFINLRNHVGSANPFYLFPASDFEGMICVFMEQLLSLNKNYFEEKGFNFNTKEAQKVLQLLVDLVNKYNTTPAIVTEFTEIPTFEYFIRNDGLFIRGWNSFDKDFKNSPFDSEKESHLRKAAIPTFSQGGSASVYGGWNLMVSRFSNKKKETIDFVKFLLSEKSQEIFYREGGYYPVVKTFYENPRYTEKYPELKESIKFMKMGTHRPANTEYTRYSKIMSYYFKKAIENKISVKEALSECTSAIQSEKVIIKEY